MTIKQLIKKYGYRTISLAIQQSVKYIPADAQHAGLFHSLEEMQMDLECALRDYAERNRIDL